MTRKNHGDDRGRQHLVQSNQNHRQNENEKINHENHIRMTPRTMIARTS